LCWRGKSKTEVVEATALALDKKELPVPEPGAMCYMMLNHHEVFAGAV
jgi:hypothetical protein